MRFSLRMSMPAVRTWRGAVARLMLAGLAIGFAATATGCTAVGAVAYKLGPAPTNPAEYKLPKEPTVVIVENYRNPDGVAVEAERLSRDITAELKQHKAAPMLDPQKVFDLRASKGEAFARLDIPAIARQVGARQVIYVDLAEFSADPPIGSPMTKGKTNATVRVVNAETGKTLWPGNSSIGRQISFETPYVNPDGTSDVSSVKEQMNEKLVGNVSRLFYDWQSDQPGGDEPEVGSGLK